MKKLLLFTGLLLGWHAYAQQNNGAGKLDARLKMWVSNPAIYAGEHAHLFKNGPVSDPAVSLIFKTLRGDASSLVKQFGGKLYSQLGSICTAEIPLSRIAEFAARPEIVRVESSQAMEVHNEKGITLIRADSVMNGYLPEQTRYSGKDVLVGIVDTGIDFLNPDFRQKQDPTQTRIVAIWDQTALNGTPPSGYAYGAYWNRQQVQQALSQPGEISQKDYSGHGTHVAGTAAGLRGIAYHADIIAVKTPLVSNGDYTFATSARTLDAVKFIYDQAVERQQACVVNMSIGFNFGAPHDGTSLFEQGLDYLCSSRWGFVICASAGNEGRDYSHHGDYNLTNDSNWTYINALNGCTWYGVSHSSSDNDLYLSVVMDSAVASFRGSGITFQKTIFQTEWMNIHSIKASFQPLTYPVLYANGDTASILTITAAAYDSTRTEWYIYTRDHRTVSTESGSSTVNLFKVAFRGSGRFHAWIQALNNLGVNLAGFNAATNARYKASDNKYVIGIPGTAKNVITVGAFVNQAGYIDLNGITRTGLNSNNIGPGALAFFSSNGPTIDGRIKPDISAPGLNVASTWSHESGIDSARMTDMNTIVYSGTSMSSPMAAGAVALLLEKFRFASFSDVKNALTASAQKENFMGATPNNVWGYGKLNIFAAMKTEVTGTATILAGEDRILAYPNPATSLIRFQLPGGDHPSRIVITDLNGRVCYSPENAAEPLDVSAWKPGMYFFTVMYKGRLSNGKFIVR